MHVGEGHAPHGGLGDADRDVVDRLVVSAEFADAVRDRITEDIVRRLPWSVHFALSERPDPKL